MQELDARETIILPILKKTMNMWGIKETSIRLSSTGSLDCGKLSAETVLDILVYSDFNSVTISK